MGKKKTSEKKELPFVSLCTPTFNRRPFWQSAIKCFMNQDYPKNKIEWIIIDDGTDKIEDLVCNIEQVKYFKYDTKMPLGKKRNLMHEKSSGDIIVYMDDDDYYPSQRISHAVNMLMTHPNALCAGASEIYIWFKHIQQMYQFGPYGPNHATAGTFAFKRELLKNHRYDDNAALAEEKAFLKDYTVPFVQLEPKKTILVFSHAHNTFDKKKLLEHGENKVQKRSTRTVDEFVKEEDLKKFYTEEIDELLNNYEPGNPSNKPDVLKQMKEIEERRKKMLEDSKNESGKIILNQNGNHIELNNQQIVQIMQQQQQKIDELNKIIREKDITIKNFTNNNNNNIDNDNDNFNKLNNNINYKEVLNNIVLQQENNMKLTEIILNKDKTIENLETKISQYKNLDAKFKIIINLLKNNNINENQDEDEDEDEDRDEKDNNSNLEIR